MQRKIVPDIVQVTEVATATADMSIADGARLMRDKKIAALIVSSGGGVIAGIVTERDMVFRALAENVDPATETLGSIMTADPDTLAPNDTAVAALELMQSRRYRHLPVVENGKCVAVVSIRDLFSAVQESLEESIKETEAFVFGDRYGA